MENQKIIAITMPKWGLSMKEGRFLNWSIDEGEVFDSGDELADVETEKIASAIEASESGRLRKCVAEEDEVYPVGALLAVASADDSVSDAEVDDFISEFQQNYVAEEDDEQVAEEDLNQFVELDGLRVRYVQKGQGDQTVLLIHGFGGDLDNWLFNQDELAQRAGASVIAIDLPGHGQSTKAVGDGSLDFFAGVIEQFVSHLQLSSIHLVGHSMGGAIALNLVKRDQIHVQSLGLIAPAGLGEVINSDYLKGFVSAVNRKQIKPVLQQLFADQELVTRQLTNNILQYKRLDGVDESLYRVQQTLLTQGDIGEGDSEGNRSATQRHQFNGVFEGFAGPKALIWGAQDQVIPAEQGQFYSELLCIEQAGHMPQMEAANQVNQTLSELIK